MQERQAAADAPLLRPPPLRHEDGPPLPVGQQLRRIYNYKFFCLFLVYCAAGCAYTALTCLLALFTSPRHNQTIVFVFVLTLSVLFALTLFLLWHAYLVATNQTTIEFYSNRMDASDARKRGERWVNPYSIGIRGIEQVFGATRNVASWLLPSRKPP